MITTVDNREAYAKREQALRFEQPFERYTLSTLAFFKRVSNGQIFQHKLRVEREVKRRRSQTQ